MSTPTKEELQMLAEHLLDRSDEFSAISTTERARLGKSLAEKVLAYLNPGMRCRVSVSWGQCLQAQAHEGPHQWEVK